jgi:outer membrane protein
MQRGSRILFAALMSLSLLICTSGGAAAQSPSDAAQASKLGPLPPLPPLPVSPTERAEKDGTALRLNLRDLAKLALQHNLDLAISDLNEELNRQEIIRNHGVYDPTLGAGFGLFSQKTANTNLSTISTFGNFSKFEVAYWNFQYQQNVKTGGNLTASFNSNRGDTNQAFFLFNPQYNASMNFNFVQPLLRNSRIDSKRGNIQLADVNLKINDSQTSQRLVETIAQILSQYWDLVGAMRNYEIKREAVRLAQVTLRDNARRLEIGTGTALAVTEARATVAQREVELFAVEEQIQVAENMARALISEDRKSEIWGKFLVPVDSPEFEKIAVDLEAATETALKKRPELEQIDLNLRSSDIYRLMGENQRKWQIDLTASFGTSGVAGPQTLIVDPLTGVQQYVISPDLVGKIGHAYKLLFNGGFTNWTVGFNLQIPLRNRNVDSQLAQVRIGARQQVMQRKNLEQQIRVEVSNAYQKMETSRKQVEQSKVSLELAKQQLWAEERRLQTGASQTFLVLQRQNEYSAAQGAELQALIAYRKSIISLQRAINTLLESYGFEEARSEYKKMHAYTDGKSPEKKQSPSPWPTSFR